MQSTASKNIIVNFHGDKHLLIIYLSLVVFATAVAFFPTLFNGFIEWDDPVYVTENDAVSNFSAQNIKKAFTCSFGGCYCPLVIMSHAVEYRFFKLDPFIYHLTNYLLHISVSLLVFYFIYLLSSNLNMAFITAVLFGLHPLHVESVAWVSERKDLLCALFYMLALTAYLIYLRNKRKRYYFLCFLFTGFSLLSKPMAVTMPFILVLLDYFLGRKVNKTLICEKLPIFALVLLFGAVNLHFQVLSGATGVIELGAGSKIYFLSKAIPFYLSKVFAPINLSIGYPYHAVVSKHFGEIKYYIAILVILAGFAVFSRRYSKKMIFGTLFFLITIAPVLKIIPAGDDFAADRYMYLPSIGVFYAVSVIANGIFTSSIAKARLIRSAMLFLFTMALIALSVLTWKRCGLWKDTGTLFFDYLERYPDTPSFYNNLGMYFLKEDRVDKAIKYFEIAVMLNPEYGTARENLERVLARQKEIQSGGGGLAVPRAESARDITREVDLLNVLGVERGKSGKIDEAVFLFNEAVRLDRDHAESYNNLGYAYYMKGEYERAEEYFKKTLEIDPNHKKARINLDYIRNVREKAAGG